MNAESLRYNIKTERRKRKLTQKEVAEIIGINHKQIANYENGEDAHRGITAPAFLMAEYFGWDIDIKILPKNNHECKWGKVDRETYRISCNETVVIMDDFDYKYCPFCGRKIKVRI